MVDVIAAAPSSPAADPPPDPPASPARFSADTSALVERLTGVAVRGLGHAYLDDRMSFAHTLRLVGRGGAQSIVVEGENLRYAAMAALGLSRTDDETQQRTLGGITLEQFTVVLRRRSASTMNLGAIALSAWVSAEAVGLVDDILLDRMLAELQAARPISTIEIAWMLTAAVASGAGGRDAASVADQIAWECRNRMLAVEGVRGIYPHAVPPRSSGRLRAHVGSFADQAYSVQALARFARCAGDSEALASANRTAQSLCDLQGTAGQWWWHYDTRDGSVVERFPVYSAHQHALAPMASFDLARAGGDDHLDAVLRGLSWLTSHPETDEDIIADGHDLIWRKAGRREPGKLVRGLSSVTTAMHHGWHLPGLDRTFPARIVDHECRPYELGLLLYGWLPLAGAHRAAARQT